MRQAFALLPPYIKGRLMSQIKSVWLIILYSVFFQTFILKVKILEASMIAIGIGLVVLGLTLFLEGLFLGLMRLGSIVGSGLPKKSPFAVVLGFGLLLGFLVTLEAPRDKILCLQPVNGYHYLGYRVPFGASAPYLIDNFDKRIFIIIDGNR